MSFSRNGHTPAIIVENVSKRYLLQANQGSLRDAIAAKFKQLHPNAADRAAESRNVLWALDDVSFELPQGKALGIVGPNGAGKTTMLKILSRITRPTTGRMQVNGRLGALLELGAGFHPDLTGRENVYLYGSILGLTRQDISNKFDDIVEFSGLERFIDTPVKRYSSGMYVRLAFAVASHTNPNVLLVDEVLAVGDAEFRQKCMNRIKALQQQNVSIIFISHNLFQVQAVCDQAIFLLKGKIQYNGGVKEAIQAYESWLQKETGDNSGDTRFGFTRGKGGDDLQIRGITVLDELGKSAHEVASSDPVEIQVRFHAKKKLSSPHFQIRLIRTDGVICVLLRSATLGVDLGEVEGQATLSIRLPKLQLTSGTYVVDTWIRDSLDAVTLAMGQSAAFDVIGSDISGIAQKGGVFEPEVEETTIRIDPVELPQQL